MRSFFSFNRNTEKFMEGAVKPISSDVGYKVPV
jgi:hypothetical protein